MIASKHYRAAQPSDERSLLASAARKFRSLVRISANDAFYALKALLLGEALGLAIGVYSGYSPVDAFWLAAPAGYVAAILVPVLRAKYRQDIPFSDALHALWIGESVSAGAMTAAFHGAYFLLSDFGAVASGDPRFFLAPIAAAAAAFLAAWPLNLLLLKMKVKARTL